ncbi:MAG: MFS transporter, partial [Pseudomonadota bacterium]
MNDANSHQSLKARVLGGIGEAYGDRNFRIYSIGSIGSWISFFVQLVAVAWLTWELTESTLWLAIMALLDIVPGVILMPFTGVFADRYDRHRIMIWVCSLSLLQAGTLAAFSWMGILNIAALGILVFIHSVIIAFMVPAMYGVLPRFVAKPVLPSAIAVSSSYVQVAVFAVWFPHYTSFPVVVVDVVPGFSHMFQYEMPDAAVRECPSKI